MMVMRKQIGDCLSLVIFSTAQRTLHNFCSVYHNIVVENNSPIMPWLAEFNIHKVIFSWALSLEIDTVVIVFIKIEARSHSGSPLS